MKRKFESENEVAKPAQKKASKVKRNVCENFRSGLFEQKAVKGYKSSYKSSEPYKHAVVENLMSDDLLRSVRSEILEHIHFTPKETDIYKIHQSGDLANLSGLPASALEKLPSLLKLRDSLYSPEFRAWISQVSGAGALSGSKTDMAVNVYAPGCHLLCHDDVIGSRRVSYILYLTNPDKPWKASWGGALRLYPTKTETADDGKKAKTPHYEWTKVIPPAWNQLSFFAVQPGASFHDVEEVYKREAGTEVDDGGRVRMAISGWFHIPQEGEQGYEPGLEEKLAEKSSLQQLQGKNDWLDLPQPQWTNSKDDQDIEVAEDELTEKDINLLLQFMTPHYLTPDTVEELGELFADESSLQLANILSKKFSARLRDEIAATDGSSAAGDEESSGWRVARPPHKHRYLFRQPCSEGRSEESNGSSPRKSAYDSLLQDFLPSSPFKKWLALATGLGLGKSSILARRFRRGLDYTLATAHEEEDAQLEWCINLTPSKGWGADEQENEQGNGTEESTKSNGKPHTADHEEEDNVGGYELYMAGDEDEDDDDGSDHGVDIPSGSANPSATGAGNRRMAKQKKADPAIYKAAADEEDDGILFSNPAAWNTMSIVLRDKGTLKFVKYVSQAAQGDRWDITGNVEVLDDGEEDDDEDENGDGPEAAAKVEENDDNEDEEEEWNGFED